LWLFDFPEVERASATLLRDGRPIREGEVEDYAVGKLALANRVNVRIACSWNLSAGQDSVIEATLYGTEGGAQMRNKDGSFFDFAADLFKGRGSEPIASTPDDWGGRAAAEWVRKLAAGERFAGSTQGLLETARALDRLYGRG
jgi:predicted dehydrogenase